MKRIPCAFSSSPEFLALIDARAAALGMNRSQYIVQALKQDLANQSKPFSIVAETPPPYVTQPVQASVKSKKK